MNPNDLKAIIEQVIKEMSITPDMAGGTSEANSGAAVSAAVIEEGFLPDVTEMDIRTQYLVEDPQDKEGYADQKKHAPCRLGIGKAGARLKTLPLLQFRAAHSAAQDAVFSAVDEDFVEKMGLPIVQSRCESKDVFLTRPDLGRKLSDEGVEFVKTKCEKGPRVQIMVADGLSSASVAANIGDLLPALMQGLQRHNISAGKPFFIKFGRVGIMDQVSELLNAEATCILIGERPGLITAESMSAYMAYKATVDMPEARRTVVSNIHSAGTGAAEAGAHVADLIKLMLETKSSGTDLKL